MDKSTFCKMVRIERTDDLTELLENICQDNNINNYFGTISVAVEGVLNFIFAASKKQSEKIKFGFEQCVGGVSISIECESVSFEALVKKTEQSEQTDNVDALVIHLLSDKVRLLSDGRGIKLSFLIGGIEPELLSLRQELTLQYFNTLQVVKS